MFERMVERGFLAQGKESVTLTTRGVRCCEELGIDVAATGASRRALCRACLDWSARRHHLAGALGAALLQRILDLGWARRARASRVVHFTPHGETALLAHLGRRF